MSKPQTAKKTGPIKKTTESKSQPTTRIGMEIIIFDSLCLCPMWQHLKLIFVKAKGLFY